MLGKNSLVQFSHGPQADHLKLLKTNKPTHYVYPDYVKVQIK